MLLKYFFIHNTSMFEFSLTYQKKKMFEFSLWSYHFFFDSAIFTYYSIFNHTLTSLHISISSWDRCWFSRQGLTLLLNYLSILQIFELFLSAYIRVLWTTCSGVARISIISIIQCVGSNQLERERETII